MVYPAPPAAQYAAPPRVAVAFDSPLPLLIAGLGLAACSGVLIASGRPIAIALLVGIVPAALALWDLRAAVCLWIPLTFLDRISIGPNLITLLLTLAWLAVVAMQAGRIAELARRNLAVVVAFGLLLGWVTLSVTWARHPDEAAADLWLWFVSAAIFALVATMAATRHHLSIACAAYVAGALLSLCVGAGTIGTGVSAIDEGRFGGSLGDPNELAAALLPALALALALAAGPLRKWPPACFGAAVLLVCGLALTGSRGAMLAALVAIAAAIGIIKGRRIEIALLTALALFSAAAVVAARSPDTFDHLREFDAGGTGRADLWRVAWRIGSDEPLLGIGINNYRSEAVNYVLEPGRLEAAEFVAEDPHYPHNIYLQQFAETGLPGVGLLLALTLGSLVATATAIGRFERAGDRPMRNLTRGILIAQVAALSASFFLSNVHDKRLWVVLALGAAALGTAPRAGRTDVAI